MLNLTLPELVCPDLELTKADLSFLSRLLAKSVAEGDWNGTPHWIFTGGLNNQGYAQVWHNDEHRIVLAHRKVWEILRGPIPERAHVDHLCRTTPCWNLAHTEPVTPSENVRRGLPFRGTAAPSKDRPRRAVDPTRKAKAEVCPHGHAMTAENVYEYTTLVGYVTRSCRTCSRERQRIS